jgi:hypothetical protein
MLDPTSNVDIDEAGKVNVLVSLMSSCRSERTNWHNQAYIAAVSSFGLLLAVFKVWMDVGNKRWVLFLSFIMALGFFELLTQQYLTVANQKIRGNNDVILKCEHALKLKDENVYFQGNHKFFWREPNELEKGLSGDWFKDIRMLRISHIVVSIFLATMLIISFVMAKLAA